MKVKDLLEQLKDYEPDTELIVAYWDKQTIEEYCYDYDEDNNLTVTEDQWSQVVSKYQDGEWNFQTYASELFVDLVGEVLKEETPNE